MYGTAYDRKIANEVHKINQRFVKYSDDNEMSDELIPANVMSGRGKLGRPRKVNRNLEMATEMPMVNVSGSGFLDNVKKAINIGLKVAPSIIKATPKVIDVAKSVKSAVSGGKRGRPRKVMSGGEMIGGAGDIEEMYGSAMTAGAKKYNKKGEFMDFLQKNVKRKGKGMTGGEMIGGEMIGGKHGMGMTGGKITPKERGQMVSAYMKKHKCSLGEASRAVSAHMKLKGGSFGSFFKKIGHAVENVAGDVYSGAKAVGKTALQLAPTVVSTVAKNPELLAMAV
jgi:hypothetical protein